MHIPLLYMIAKRQESNKYDTIDVQPDKNAKMKICLFLVVIAMCVTGGKISWNQKEFIEEKKAKTTIINPAQTEKMDKQINWYTALTLAGLLGTVVSCFGAIDVMLEQDLREKAYKIKNQKVK